MTYKEIYDKCVPEAKRAADKLNVWLYYVVRPLSIVGTKPLLKTSMTPTAVTALSMISTLIGFGLVSFGNTLEWKIVGWSGFFMWAILDCVDGNIARCKGQCSKRGELWDAAGGYLALSLIFFSSGISGFYEKTFISLWLPEWNIILGGMTALLSIYPRLIAQKKRAISDTHEVLSVMDKKNFSFPRIIAMNIESAIGLMQVLFLCSLVFQISNVFIAFYFMVNLAICVVSLRDLLK
jgi:phosphatidylglycerophosphate synthase